MMIQKSHTLCSRLGASRLSHVAKSTLLISYCSIVASACDTGEAIPIAEAEVATADLALDWEAVPMPESGAELGGVMPGAQNPPASPALQPWTVEIFSFSSEYNFLALTQMAGGLFALLPAGMSPLPPELDDGFLLGFTFYDQEGEIAGFGTEQEVIDWVSATGQTTYTLTIPGRGTLMLAQEEEFAYMFDVVDDMIAEQEFVREFNPPLVNVHTVPGSARIVGGTGEFTDVKGYWREISTIYEFDLLTGLHNVGISLQIMYH
jgi:hypothetical protein